MKYVIEGETLQKTADAIRSSLGSSLPIATSDMSSKIGEIKSIVRVPLFENTRIGALVMPTYGLPPLEPGKKYYAVNPRGDIVTNTGNIFGDADGSDVLTYDNDGYWYLENPSADDFNPWTVYYYEDGPREYLFRNVDIPSYAEEGIYLGALESGKSYYAVDRNGKTYESLENDYGWVFGDDEMLGVGVDGFWNIDAEWGLRRNPFSVYCIDAPEEPVNWLFKNQNFVAGVFRTDLPTFDPAVYDAYAIISDKSIVSKKADSGTDDPYGILVFDSQDGKGLLYVDLIGNSTGDKSWFVADENLNNVSVFLLEKNGGNNGDDNGGWTLTDYEGTSTGEYLSISDGYLYTTFEMGHDIKDDGATIGKARIDEPYDLSVLDTSKTYTITDRDLGEFAANLVYK